MDTSSLDAHAGGSRKRKAPVKITLPAPPTSAEIRTKFENAYESSLKCRLTLELPIPALLPAEGEAIDVTSSGSLLGWQWSASLEVTGEPYDNSKVSYGHGSTALVDKTGPYRFVLKVVSPTVDGVAPLNSSRRTQQALEGYIRIKYVQEASEGKPATLNSPESIMYFFWYPQGQTSEFVLSRTMYENLSSRCRFRLLASLQSFIKDPPKDPSETFGGGGKLPEPICLKLEVFDVSVHSVIDFSLPPTIPSPMDCSIVCEGGKVLYCNKRMLATYSSYFSKLFFETDFEEKKKGSVSLTDLLYEDMYDFIIMLHNQPSPITDGNVAGRLSLADRLGAVLITQRCETHLIGTSGMSTEKRVELAMMFRLHRLVHHILSEMNGIDDMKKMMKSPAYQDMDNRTKAIMLERFMQLQHLWKNNPSSYREEGDPEQEREIDPLFRDNRLLSL